MLKFPLDFSILRIDRAQCAPVRLGIIGRKIGAAVVCVPGFVGLRRGAEFIALLTRIHVEEAGLRIEGWRFPVGCARRSRADDAAVGCGLGLLVRDGAAFGISAVTPS